jgi:hypothetical protein
VGAGWNLIGSLSTPVPVSSVQQSVPGLIVSRFFSYENGYAVTSSIDPGKGCWVKASGAGTLTLNAGPAAGAGTTRGRTVTGGADAPRNGVTDASDPAGLNSLTIRDAAGSKQVLYFGARTNAVNPNDFELPPVAPAEAFDIRFATQRDAAFHPAAMKEPAEFPILIQSAKAPLTLSWTIRSTAGVYRLSATDGKPLTAKPLSGKGSLTLDRAGMTGLVLEAAPQSVPKAFALYQNYPNPFNPTTQIRFDVPARASITLKVFNILGQEVQTLLHGERFDAGAYTVSFDGSGYPSGVYFYRISSETASPPGTFVSVRKMVFIR